MKSTETENPKADNSKEETMLWETELPLDDVKRYSRQIILPKVKVDGQKALDKAKVLVVGLGGLGSPVLMYLATTGIRTIGIADYDVVELHNLQRQIIHTEENVGKSKTASAREFVAKLNSSVSITEHNVQLGSGNIMDIVRGYDVVADCCDNIQLRYVLNDACRVMGKDLVSASVLRWEGQVCVAKRGGACYRCMFPEMKASASSCDMSGVMGPVCGIVGSLQANEIVKLILEKNMPADPVSSSSCNIGTFVVFNGILNLFKTFQKSYKICTVCRTRQMGEILPASCGLSSVFRAGTIPWSKIIEHIKDYVIVDIRNTEHFQMFRVAGSVNIPDIEKNVERVKQFYKPVVVSCYRGKSSRKAADFLNNSGVEAYSSEGGIEGFKDFIGFKTLT